MVGESDEEHLVTATRVVGRSADHHEQVAVTRPGMVRASGYTGRSSSAELLRTLLTAVLTS